MVITLSEQAQLRHTVGELFVLSTLIRLTSLLRILVTLCLTVADSRAIPSSSIRWRSIVFWCLRLYRVNSASRRYFMMRQRLISQTLLDPSNSSRSLVILTGRLNPESKRQLLNATDLSTPIPKR